MLLPAYGRYSQPDRIAEIDWSNPVTKHLSGAVYPIGNTFFNAVTRVFATQTSPSSLVNSALTYNGKALRGRTGQGTSGAARSSPLRKHYMDKSSSVGVFTLAVCPASGSASTYFGGLGSSGGGYQYLHPGFITGSNQIAIRGRVSSGNFMEGVLIDPVAPPFGEVVAVAATTANNEQAMWVDGRLADTSTENSARYDYLDSITSNAQANTYTGLVLAWAKGISDDLVRELTENPWQIFKPEIQRSYFFVDAGGGGGTTYNQSIAGSITASGLLYKLIMRNLAGTSTPTNNALAKATSRTLEGTSVPTNNAFSKATTKTPALTGSITPSGTVSATSVFTQLAQGSITLSGAISKLILKGLTGSSTPTGAISKLTYRTLVGSLTAFGNIAKRIDRTITGSITPSGFLAQSYTTSKALAGSITTTGAVATLFIVASASAAIDSSLTFLRRFIGRR